MRIRQPSGPTTDHVVPGARCWAVALLLLCALAAPLTAQPRAVVNVFVRGPDGPLPGAVVSIGERDIAADERGIARFELGAGSWQLRVHRPGYATERTTLAFAAERDTMLVVRLMPLLVTGEPIIVSATRMRRRIEEEPLRVEVIAREEIEEKLLMTPGSIAMVLDEAMGVRVQPTAPALGGASVRIQGLRGRYTRMLVDGLPLHGARADALAPLQIPPMDVRQVEIIKGPASALYGGAALGGVINLVSREPEDEREVLVNRTSRGGTDLILWSADMFGEAVGYTLLGGLHAQDAADISGDGWSELPRHRRVLTRPRLYWNGATARAMVTGGYMAESRTGGGFVPGGERWDQELESRHIDAGATAHWAVREDLFVDARAAVSGTTTEHVFGDRMQHLTSRNALFEVAVAGHIAEHEWLVGIAAEHEFSAARDLDGFDHQHVMPALFVQDEVRLAPWLVMSGSGRVDFHADHGSFFSPRGAVLVGPLRGWTLRLSAGTGFALPTPHVEELEEIGLARLLPPEGLEAERGHGMAADIGALIGPLELNATVFGSEISNPIVFRESVEAGFGELINLPRATRTRGTELLTRLRLAPFSLTAFYTYTVARQADPFSLRAVDAPLTPRHRAGFVGVWEDHDIGRFGVEAYYTGWQRLVDDPFASQGAPYWLIGALIERRIGPVSVFVNAENIGNVRLTRDRPFIRPAATGLGRWTTDVWMPLEGRIVNGGFRVFF